MKRWPFATALALLFAFPLLMLGQNSEPVIALKVGKPVAISGTTSTGYFVLTADGVVYRYANGPSGLTFSGRFNLPMSGQATDLTMSRMGQQDSVIVASWSSSEASGWIYRYSPEGKMLHSWRISKVVSGLATDDRNQILYFTAYFSSVASNELYRINLPGGQPEFVCTIKGIERAGAIAVDAGAGIVYVADAFGGKLIQIDLSSKQSTVLTKEFKLPSAIYLKDESRTVYVADAVRKTVSAINLAGPATNSTVVGQSSKFRSPSGLAPGPGESLLVVDSEADAVFLLQLGPRPPVAPAKSKKH
jgi:DNA-binding beta-propeller fold protein YncE